jgi:hypothetical protein
MVVGFGELVDALAQRFAAAAALLGCEEPTLW